MDFRGGPPQEQAAAAVPSLLQMAQGDAPQGAQNYAPAWVTEEWNRTPAAAPMDGGGVGGGGFGGYTRDQLAPWYNPANWGPPPQIDAQGRANPAATGGFWSGGAALKQQAAKFGGQPGPVLDERPNTFNWRLLGGQAAAANNPMGSEPGNYMTMGHQISQLRRGYDLRLGTDPSGYEGGGNWSALRFGADRALGPEFPAMRPHGSASAYGIPGQLEPWWVTLNGPL